jgi:hypothetical protein
MKDKQGESVSTTDTSTPEHDRRVPRRPARRRGLLIAAALSIVAVAVVVTAGWLIVSHQHSTAVAEARELRDLRAAELTTAHDQLSEDLDTARSVLASSVGIAEVGRLSDGLSIQVDSMSTYEILYAEPFKNPSDSDVDALRRQAELLTGYVENIEEGRPGLVEATTALEEALGAPGVS